MYTLRYYQTQAVDECRSLLRQGIKNILLCAPTGAGKTLLACLGIIAPAVAKGKRVLFLAPRKQLILQTSDKLLEIGIKDHGVLMGTHWRYRPASLVQVGSRDTVIRRLDKIARPDIIISDEVHNQTDKNGYGVIANHWGDHPVRIGMTATPLRMDGKGLGCIYQRIVHVSSVKQLMNEGFLVRPEWKYINNPDLTGIKTGADGDYVMSEVDAKWDTTTHVTDIVGKWIEHAKGLPTVIFARTVKSSLHIVEMFRAAGISAIHIDANSDPVLRKKAIEDTAAGINMVLVSVGVFTEGFDMPECGCVILDRPTKSTVLYIQMVGRGLRPKNGIAQPGEVCIFLDFWGLAFRHGPITMAREWSLEDAPNKKDRPKKVIVCKHCKEVLPNYPPVCPHCGALLKDENDIGEQLEVPIDTAEMKILDLDAMERKIVLQRQQYFAQLVWEGFTNKRKPAWVGMKFKDRYGSWHKKEDRVLSPIELVYDKEAKLWSYSAKAKDEPAPDDLLTDGARRLLRWIEKNPRKGFTFREAWQSLKGRGFESADGFAEALDELVEHGFLRELPIAVQTMGRQKTRPDYQVLHPDLLPKQDESAKATTT